MFPHAFLSGDLTYDHRKRSGNIENFTRRYDNNSKLLRLFLDLMQADRDKKHSPMFSDEKWGSYKANSGRSDRPLSIEEASEPEEQALSFNKDFNRSFEEPPLSEKDRRQYGERSEANIQFINSDDEGDELLNANYHKSFKATHLVKRKLACK